MLCFRSTILLLVFPILPGFQDAWGGPFSIPQIIFISASVSLLELFSIRVGTLTLNDNLYVPAVVVYWQFLSFKTPLFFFERSPFGIFCCGCNPARRENPL